MEYWDFLNNPTTFFLMLISIAGAVGTMLATGLRWLRAEVTKENKVIKAEVQVANKLIKEEAIERIDQNRQDIRIVEGNISKELTHNNIIVTTKLDNIQLAAKDISRTLDKTEGRLHNHETRISVVETKVNNGTSSGTNNAYKNRRGINNDNNDNDNNGNN
jgi:hypothetical protein